MKKIKNITLVLIFICAAGALTISAQDAQPAAETVQESPAPEQKAPAKKAVKKKVVKKIKKQLPKPVSEYKFDKVETIPAYKFDKNANPIIKDSAPKKKAVKPAKSKSAAAKQKLKVQPPIDGGVQPQDDQQQPQSKEGE